MHIILIKFYWAIIRYILQCNLIILTKKSLGNVLLDKRIV